MFIFSYSSNDGDGAMETRQDGARAREGPHISGDDDKNNVNKQWPLYFESGGTAAMEEWDIREQRLAKTKLLELFLHIIFFAGFVI